MSLVIDVVPTVTPDLGPTICIPVRALQHLTTNENAITLGWYGFMAGIAVPILVVIGYHLGVRYVVPWFLARRGRI